MGSRVVRRLATAVLVTIFAFGSAPTLVTGRDPVRGPNLQDLPFNGNRGWTDVSTDLGRVKPATPPPAPAAPPSGAMDVPGQVVPAVENPTGPIVTPIGISSAEVARIRDVLAEDGQARVNVTLAPPRGLTANAQSVDRHRPEIARSLNGLRDGVRGAGARELSRIDVYPWASYQVTGAAFEALLRHPNVTSLTLDAPVELALESSTGIIRSKQLNAAGGTGSAWGGSPYGHSEIVIIDSGVDNDHAAFAGRVVDEACFSAGADCPGGFTAVSGVDTAENCTYDPRCAHGTHTASIAAGNAFAGGASGVARGARIVPIQVGSFSATGWTAMFSDINNALQYAINRKNAGANVVAVNLSLHIPGFVRNAVCDAENGDFAATQALAASLQGLGVAVVAAAGNDNDVGVSYPACLSSVYAVSATNGSTTPSGSTNSGAQTDWWAPGVGIDAAMPGTDAHATRSGTSTAAPHVSGAFALLRQCVDGNGNQIGLGTAVSQLNSTGPNVTDNGATRRRINVLEAATRLVNNNDFDSPEALPASGTFDDFDFNICSDAEPGEPGPFSVDNGVWWSFTPSATSTVTISTEDSVGFLTTFDTTLAVYTGSSLASLVAIASDDDSGTGLRSLVTVPVNAGTTYRVKVDGFAAATGLLNLHIEYGPAPTCLGVAATIVGTVLADTISGTAGADVIVAGPGNDTISGGGGNDRVCGDEGNDTISTGAGDDVVAGGSGADDIHGGTGNDTLLGNPGGGSTDDVGDVIQGGAGHDTLDGWTGNDTLVGGGGNDVLIGAAGIDTVDYSTHGSGVTASLTAGTATGAGSDSFFEVEKLIGTEHDDTLTGNGVKNTLNGRGGDDTISGQGNADTLLGGDGNDSMFGGGGNDTVRGNDGNDALFGEAGTDTCVGGAGTDTAAGSCETTFGVP